MSSTLGGVAQPGSSGARLKALLAPQGGLVFEQDGEPFAVLEIACLGILGELAEAVRHALQAELVQQIKGGMVEHRELLNGSSAGRGRWRARSPPLRRSAHWDGGRGCGRESRRCSCS